MHGRLVHIAANTVRNIAQVCVVVVACTIFQLIWIAHPANLHSLCLTKISILLMKFENSSTPEFFIYLIFKPAQSTFLFQKPNQEAENSILFYQNLRDGVDDHEILQSEMTKLKNSLHKSGKCEANSFNWSDLLRNPGRKAFLIGIGLAILNQFCGCIAMSNYTANIFKESGSTLSPNNSAICVGVIQLIGSFVAMNLVDRAGRKV